jgi:D-sedoheptulose 7-phosphate isomerase
VSITAAFDALQQLLSSCAVTLPPLLDQSALMLVKSLQAGGKVMVCGNGGSAADAQHFAAELVGRFEVDRRAIPAVALTADSSVLTAIANDTGFEQVFARQVEALARPGDVLIGISTSGCSENVLAAARAARARDCVIIGLTGAGGGLMVDLCDLLIAVPSSSVARIQEIHILCLHALASQVEAVFGEVTR